MRVWSVTRHELFMCGGDVGADRGGGDFYYHISYLVIHSSVDTVLNISLKVSQILYYHSQLTSVFSIYIINNYA